MLQDRIPEPMILAAAPARYPAPDWEAIATVARVWVPDDETVGWAIFQNGERLAFLSTSKPDDLGFVVRDLVLGILREGAKSKTPATKTWEMILASTLHTTPTDLYLPALTADIGREQET